MEQEDRFPEFVKHVRDQQAKRQQLKMPVVSGCPLRQGITLPKCG
jgi:hypothetical protein